MYEKEATCYGCNHFGSRDMCIGMVLFYVYEIVIVNGFIVEVCGVLGFVVFVFSDPKTGDNTARPAVPVLLFETYWPVRVIGRVPRPLVAYIEAMRKFFCKEYPFEPVEVVGSGLPSTHDVFEHDAVVTISLFEQSDNIRNIGFVLDKAVAGYEYAFFAEAYTQVECACATGYLSLDVLPLAAGEGL